MTLTLLLKDLTISGLVRHAKVTWTIQTLQILNAIHVLSTIVITADGTSSKTNMNALNVLKEQSSIQ